jgi:hypothetical protein
MRLALAKGLASGVLARPKSSAAAIGATGSFKLGKAAPKKKTAPPLRFELFFFGDFALFFDFLDGDLAGLLFGERLLLLDLDFERLLGLAK